MDAKKIFERLRQQKSVYDSGKWILDGAKQERYLKITARRPEKYDVSSLLQGSLTERSRKAMNISGSYSLESSEPKRKLQRHQSTDTGGDSVPVRVLVMGDDKRSPLIIREIESGSDENVESPIEEDMRTTVRQRASRYAK